jgi:hypothetical protein
MRRFVALAIATSALVGAASCARDCTPRSNFVAQYKGEECCDGKLYTWNGMNCAEMEPRFGTNCGCECSGPDCDKVFKSLEACERAYKKCIE